MLRFALLMILAGLLGAPLAQGDLSRQRGIVAYPEETGSLSNEERQDLDIRYSNNWRNALEDFQESTLLKRWEELEARAAMGRYLAGFRYGKGSQEEIESLYYLTLAKTRLGKAAEAVPLAEEGIELLGGLETTDVGAKRLFQRLLAQAQAASGDAPGARRTLEGILNSATISDAPRGRELSSILEELAKIYVQMERLVQASQKMDQAIGVLEAIEGVEDAEVADLEFTRATILHRRKLYRKAETSCRRVLKLFKAEENPRQPQLVEVHARLGLILEELGDRAGALEQSKRARKTLLNTSGPNHPFMKELDDRIARLSPPTQP